MSTERPVVHFVHNTVESDGRVRKMGRSLRSQSYPVVYLGVGPPDASRMAYAFIEEAEPIDGCPRYLLRTGAQFLYDTLLSALNRINPVKGEDERVSGALARLWSDPDLAPRDRAMLAGLLPFYGTLFGLHRLRLLRLRGKGWLRLVARLAVLLDRLHTLRPRLIHAHDLYAYRLVAPYARQAGIPLVYDSHELESGRNYQRWSYAEDAWQKTSERLTIGMADRVVTVSPGIQERLQSLYGIPEPVLLVNSPPRATIRPNQPLRARMGLPEDHRVILYLGGLQAGRGLGRLLRMMRELPQHVHLMCIGPTLDYFEPEVHAAIGDDPAVKARVHLRPPVPYDEVVHTAWGADLGFNGLELVCESYQNALPNKFFEYVFAGVPVISTPARDIVRLTREHQLGAIYEDGSDEALRQTLFRWIEHGEPGPIPAEQRERFIERFAWETMEGALFQMYEELLAERP